MPGPSTGDCSTPKPLAHLLTIERFLPPYRYEQAIVIEWVRRWLERTDDPQVQRLLSVYTSSAVRTRASVVPIEQVFAPADFETQTTSMPSTRAR